MAPAPPTQRAPHFAQVEAARQWARSPAAQQHDFIVSTPRLHSGNDRLSYHFPGFYGSPGKTKPLTCGVGQSSVSQQHWSARVRALPSPPHGCRGHAPGGDTSGMLPEHSREVMWLLPGGGPGCPPRVCAPLDAQGCSELDSCRGERETFPPACFCLGCQDFRLDMIKQSCGNK